MKIKLFSSAIFLIFALIATNAPLTAHAQELHNEVQETIRGKVLEVENEEVRFVPGTNTEHIFQVLKAEIISGANKGETVTIDNDYLELQKGDYFYANYHVDIDGTERYIVTNVDRRYGLIFLVLLFIATVVIFGGWQGVRSLVALVGSFVAIFYILMPGLLSGWNPLLASFLVASGVLFAAIFFTHGFNRESLVAFSGTMIAVLLTGLFAIFAVHITSLSGFTGEETTYLNFNTQGSLNFTSLLLGAIIIGVLGVLDDIAVTQSAVVSELFNSTPDMSRKEVYKRAIRVGREHVGALVNTLVLAYTGASLPLLLLFYLSPASVGSTLNMEIFATEIVRMIVGSIGLILTVPIVTLLAVFYLKDYVPKHHRHVHSH